MAKVAWIGLGVMGYPMAGHIRNKGGQDLTVYNRNAAKADAWCKEFQGSSAPTAAEAAKGAELVFCCVGNDNDLREVTLGPKGAFNSVKRAPSLSITRPHRPILRASCMPQPEPKASAFWMHPYRAAKRVHKTGCSR